MPVHGGTRAAYGRPLAADSGLGRRAGTGGGRNGLASPGSGCRQDCQGETYQTEHEQDRRHRGVGAQAEYQANHSKEEAGDEQESGNMAHFSEAHGAKIQPATRRGKRVEPCVGCMPCRFRLAVLSSAPGAHMKKHARRLILILSAVAVLAGLVTASIFITKNWLTTVSWENPSLDQVADGSYAGEARLDLPPGGAVANSAIKLVVRVKDHKYVGFAILEPANIAGAMADLGKEVIARQSLDIDGLSGATATKVVFLSAIANAVARK